MEVTLQEILDARERRADRRRELLQQFGRPVITFTMNIPGPEKLTALISRGFDLGNEMLRAQLEGEGVSILHFEQSREHTGCQAMYVADAPAERLKRLTVQIEDSIPAARLFDMDVAAPGGAALSRETLGLPERQCLLCSAPARICGRSRAHSVQALREKTDALLTEALDREDARHIAVLAARALTYEVCTTPKPGLVDRENNGSHRDMDIFSFMSSAAALQPYFYDCAMTGIKTRELPPQETFEKLRLPGKLAQKAMLEATGGANTHKGAIFTLGLACGALGRLARAQWSRPGQVLALCAAMTKGLTERELGNITPENAVTAGQRLYAEYGITGVRGQAEAGFPAVLDTGLPVLEQGIGGGLSLNDAGCAALLALMTATVDTNLIARSDRQTQQKVCRDVALLLSKELYPDKELLHCLDELFVGQNLSPGGSADLLALTYLLYFLKKEA